MRLTLAKPRGFCTGVKRAIGMLSELVRCQSPPIYVYHEIVHNKRVVESFKAQGVIFVESLDEIPVGSTVLFSAHGVSPVIVQQANARQLVMVDATCPRVATIHSRARSFATQGYQIILIGHAGHDEVVGTLGVAPDKMTLVSSLPEVEELPFTAQEKLTYLVQTTFLATEFQAIVARICQRFPQLELDDGVGLCDATQRRQDALRELPSSYDLVLVIGSVNSSNSQRLAETARLTGYPVHLIDSVTELLPAWFVGKEEIFITAGASAPETIVQECVEQLIEWFGAVVV